MVAEFSDATRPDEVIEAMNKIHFVFRGKGDLGGAENMLKAMEKKGGAVLETIENEQVKKQVIKRFNQQIENARKALDKSKTIPDPGDLVVFQGKDVPYSI